MVGWESIPFFYKIYSYFKKYVDLNEKENELVAKEERLKKEEQELNKLRTISNENYQNPSEMIDFYPVNLKINALDTSPSPCLEFDFNITNRSILDFKTRNFFIRVVQSGDNSEIGVIEISREIELPHQQIVSNNLKLILHPHFISKLKLLRKEGKSLFISLVDIRIDFIGDKEFYRRGSFHLKIPCDEINVS